MITPLKKISLKQLCHQPVMFDANIFMVGIVDRGSDPHCSFENIRELYLIPIFENFQDIYIHQMVYLELDQDARTFIDGYIGKSVTVVEENNLYAVDPTYTTIFNNISQHERVLYTRGDSKDSGEVYSLAYAAHNGINYFSSKEIMVDDIARDLKDLKDIEIITFDIIVLLSYVHYMDKEDTSKNKALKSGYKKYCEDVIRRHKLPPTLKEYFIASQDYLL